MLFYTRASLLLSKSHRRTLFSLPDFSSFSAETTTYHEKKTLPYTPKQLYNVVADVASYSHFIPFCTASRILSPLVQNHTGVSTMRAELTVGFLAFAESYTSTVTCKPFESVEAVASSSTPLFRELSTIWRFQPILSSNTSAFSGPSHSSHVTSDSTLVSLDLAYAFSNPIHAAVSSAFFGQVSRQMVQAFEQRCQQVYGIRHK